MQRDQVTYGVVVLNVVLVIDGQIQRVNIAADIRLLVLVLSALGIRLTVPDVILTFGDGIRLRLRHLDGEVQDTR